MLLGLQEETALLGWGGRFQPCSKLIKCCSAGIPVSVSWGNWSPRLRHRPALGAPSNPPWARGSCSPDTQGGWYIPDSMPLSGVPGGWAAGFPRGGPVRLAGAGGGGRSPFGSVSSSQYLGVFVGCSSYDGWETQKHTPLKGVGDNDRGQRAATGMAFAWFNIWYERDCFSGMKRSRWHYSLLQSSFRGGAAAILTLHFLVISNGSLHQLKHGRKFQRP